MTTAQVMRSSNSQKTNSIKFFFMKTTKKVTSILVMLAIMISCQKPVKDQLAGTGFKIFLTDHQSLVFDKVLLDIQKLEIKVEDGGVDSLGGWFDLNITPGVFDILRFRNGIDTVFAIGNIPTGRKLQKIRMTLGQNNSVEKDGKSFPLRIKDKENEVIAKLDDTNVEFTAPDQFMFWIDFDAGRSIQIDNSGSGNGNGFRLRPQIRIFTRNRSGSIEGRVVPAEAQPIILAINGTDTTTAKPEREGEFKIVGLKAGNYSLLIDATANDYKDTLISNLVIRGNEDTKTGTIQLHK